MAPIQMEKSYDVTVSSTPAEKCSRQERSSSRAWGVFLPISRRGSFFQDAFFSDTHKDFDSSVREVLARWSGDDFQAKDFRREDIMDRYRQLRSRNLKEENQAVTVTSDKTSHKDMAAITSVLSTDGILTITAPKVKTETTKENIITQTSTLNNCEKVSQTRTQMASNDESETTQSSLSTDSERSSSARKETCSCHFGTKGTADSSRLHRGSRDTLLPITRRGDFFQDSFFSGRSSTAGMTPTSSWRTSGTRRLPRSDRLGRYRQLRSRNLWSDNQAVTVTSDNISYKIVLDMHDFVDGDVKVKLMGEELLVEALSAGSSRTFRRSFSLPESTDMTSITPVMSSDGILTITVTKKETETQQKTTVIPISVKETHNAEVHSSTSSTTSGVSEEAASGQRTSHTAQQEERKSTRCHQEKIDENKTQTAASSISSNSQQSSQKQSSVISDFASTRISDSLEAKETLGSSQDDSLAIARRGSFLQDSFFSDIRRDFDASVREILKKCDDSDLTLTGDVSHSDILSRYRQLRSRNMREENQAFCVSSDSASLKIVLDVHDFMRGDVKVKVVDEELVVEGRAEEEEGGSSVSTRSFSRRFALPHSTDMTRITSVMSSDGILTITALKTAGEPQQNSLVNFSATEERKESSTAHDSTPEAVSSTTEKNISVHENLVNVDQMEFGCERKHSYENKTRKLRKEFEFPAESKEVLKSKICHNPSVDESTTASVRGDVPIIHDHELMRLAETLESTVVEKASYDDSVSEQQEQATVQSESDSTEAIILGEEILPIVRRGSFVQDSFFLDVRQEFDAAIREVLRKWVSEDSDLTHSEDFLGLSHSDILDRYRQLRSRELKEETQVFIVTSDNTSYKIVLDVQDFMNGDLKVKVAGETEVVVEGRVERREEGSSSVSSYSFRRRFSLPEHIDMTAITCIMSSDGILTISASKMAEEPEEHKVIRSVEEVQKSSQVQRSVYPADETISLHEECEKESKATHDCMDSVESEKAREFLLSTDSAARSSHDTEFVESENQSKETIRNVESIVPEEVMTDSPTFVSDEMESCSEFAEISEASLCHKGSIAMTETSGNLSASRDFGTSSQDSLLSAIPEDENDSETVKVLHLEDSQQAVDILDLKDSEETAENLELKNSQESAAIVEAKGSEAIEILDLTDSQEDYSQEYVNILDQKDSEAAAELLDLKVSEEAVEILHLQNSQESVDILDGKDSQETVVEGQNESEAQNSKCSTIFDYENESAVQENFNHQQSLRKHSTAKGLSRQPLRVAQIRAVIQRLYQEKEAVDCVGPRRNDLKPKNPTQYNITSSTTIAKESAEAVESLKGTRRIHRDSPEELLLITKRGNFFQDSFFLDAHRDFSAALRQVLGRCNQDNFEDDTDLRHTDILERYRQLRCRDLREENQAAIVTSDKSCMKIIVDVHDFMSGDVQAKVVDDELVIEGLVVKKEEGTSSETSYSFRRRFSLPQFTKITSVMSLDGILTVTEGNVEANTAENSIKTEAKRSLTKEIIQSESLSLPAEKRLLETKNENQNGLNEYVTSQSEETRHFSRDFTSGTKTPYLDCSFEDSNRLRRFGQESGRESQETNRYNVTQDTSLGTSSRLASGSLSSFAEKSFPITRKGHFFSHYFFRDTKRDFQKAVREILSRWGEVLR
nr:uncharacterized protein LOC113825302 [Penaeus vannamei]